MKVEELIKYRDEFNDILLIHQKKNKKWSIITIITYLVGFLLIIIPAAVVGDNQGNEKPIEYYIFTIIGIAVLLIGIVCTIFYIYHRVIIVKNKKYKDTLSHELTLLVMKHKEETDKDFPFLKKN